MHFGRKYHRSSVLTLSSPRVFLAAEAGGLVGRWQSSPKQTGEAVGKGATSPPERRGPDLEKGHRKQKHLTGKGNGGSGRNSQKGCVEGM